LIASGPEVGDLAMFGVTGLETVECLVKSIRQANDYTAELTLVDLASAIYTADTGTIPAFNPSMTIPIDVTRVEPDPPTIDSVATGIDVATTSGGGSISTIQVYLSAPQDHIKIRGYRVRYRLEGETQWQYTAEQNSLTIPVTNVSDQLTYEIQAQSISVYGIESQWTTVTTGSSDLPQIVPPSSTNISAAMVDSGTAYSLSAVLVTFTPPNPPGVYAYSEIYACSDNATYKYMGRDSTGSFLIKGLGVIYKTGDTCYIKIRSVSNFGVRELLPATASASVVITATIKIASFYFGLYDQWAGNASISHADTKIVLGNLGGVPKLALGPSADAITFAGTQTGIFLDGDGYFRAGGSVYGMTFNPSTGILQADKVKVGSGTNYIDIDGGNSRIQSSNYVSGYFGAGFSLTPELFEVGNIAARGIIRTSVFQYDSISAHGGSRVLAHGADVLSTDMTALDASTLTIAGNETWAVNDRLRIKEGTDDEWFVITSIAAAPTYAVTRDMDAQYTSNNNPIWKKGAAVVNYGQSGDGGIYETASETNAPYLSVYTHAGSPWDTITPHIRMGNLNGYAGYTSDVYGWAAYIDANNYIKIDPVSGIDMSGKITLKSGSAVDWGYVSGTGKPANYADVTDYADIRVANALAENNVTTIRQPNGGTYSGEASEMGAIVIILPQSWTDTMMRFAIDVYLYSSSGNTSFTAMVGGYNSTAGQWINEFAQIIGSTEANNRVRFGHNGTSCCIVIGDTSSLWGYPKINIRDFQAGYSNYAISQWEDGWGISFNPSVTGYTFTGDYADALLDAKAIKDQGALATMDESDVELDNLTGTTHATVLQTILDSGYVTLLRASATANQRVTITASGVEQYTNGVKMIELASGNLYLGDQANEHLKASSTGIEIKDGATVKALFGSTVVVGTVAAGKGNVYISSNGDIEGRINTTVRWHLDSDGSGWLGDANNFYWDTTGTPYLNYLKLVGITAGDILAVRAPAVETTSLTSPTKKKEINIGCASGTYRVKFDLMGNGTGAYSVYGRIYINGTAVGSTESEPVGGSLPYVTKSADIAIPAGALVQVYIWAESNPYGNAVNVKNFNIYASTALVPVVTLD
jgi:hypothetical protein